MNDLLEVINHLISPVAGARAVRRLCELGVGNVGGEFFKGLTPKGNLANIKTPPVMSHDIVQAKDKPLRMKNDQIPPIGRQTTSLEHIHKSLAMLTLDRDRIAPRGNKVNVRVTLDQTPYLIRLQVTQVVEEKRVARIPTQHVLEFFHEIIAFGHRRDVAKFDVGDEWLPLFNGRGEHALHSGMIRRKDDFRRWSHCAIATPNSRSCLFFMPQ